jgi:hypothetical protein
MYHMSSLVATRELRQNQLGGHTLDFTAPNFLALCRDG